MAFLAAAAPWLQVGLAVFSAVSALRQGKDEERRAEANADIDFRTAADRRVRGEEERRVAARDRQRRLSSLVAGTAAGGLALSGSPLLVFQESLLNSELDLAAITSDAESEASRLESGAGLQIEQGRAARSASFFKAGSSMLTAGIHARGLLGSPAPAAASTATAATPTSGAFRLPGFTGR